MNYCIWHGNGVCVCARACTCGQRWTSVTRRRGWCTRCCSQSCFAANKSPPISVSTVLRKFRGDDFEFSAATRGRLVKSPKVFPVQYINTDTLRYYIDNGASTPDADPVVLQLTSGWWEGKLVGVGQMGG